MRVPLSWLSEFTPLEVDPEDERGVVVIRETLDGLGLVVEGVERHGDELAGVVLAQVLEINVIEGADRVRQVFVDSGDGVPLEIVCGATNFAPGDVVPLAKVGAELPDGMVISERKMRGATSKGMLCSGRELGLSDDATGLLIVAAPGSVDAPLSPEVAPGRSMDAYLGHHSEVVFDVAVEPNRPDCLSIVGIACDLAAKLGLPFSIPTPVVTESDPSAATLASVRTEAPEGCRGIVGRVLVDVSALSSPELVRRRLELCGMRPINVLVDASNYVMIELGQPTHPYDLDRVAGGEIVARLARGGETLVTLDGTSHLLGEQRGADGATVEVDELVIADGAGSPVGLAGVMGGKSSEITETTSRVLVEVASFDSLLVGQAAARHGLRSEASARFWRGTDPAGLERVADRFCELVQQASIAAGAQPPPAARGLLVDRPVPYEERSVVVRPERVNRVLGTELGIEAITVLLEPIGFTPRRVDGELLVTLPSWRPDASREADVIEEIARHYGYERIGASERRARSVGGLNRYQRRRRQLRRALQGAGASEAWTSSILDPRVVERAGATGPFIEISNPIVRDETVLRPTLLPGLLGALAHNESHRNGDIRLFECGVVFGSTATDERPRESEQLGVLLARNDDATSAMALFGYLVEALGIDPDGYVIEQGEHRPIESEELATGLHPTRCGLVMARRAEPKSRPVLAVVGEVDPAVLDAFGISGRRVGWIVAPLQGLFELPARPTRAEPVSRDPSSDLDLAFIVDDEVPASRLAEHLARGAGELLSSLRLIDVYRGSGVPDGTRSLTYRLRLGAFDRTLSERELAEVRLSAIQFVESRLPARLRS